MFFSEQYSYSALKKKLENEADITDEVVSALLKDKRKKVRFLIQKYLDRKKKSTELLHFEKQLWEKGYSYVAGVDEAGRGSLAGPVVVASVIFPKNFTMIGIDDSKKLSNSVRMSLVNDIKKNAVSWQIAVISNEQIDELNIYNATSLGAQNAISNLSPQPDFVLFDGKIDFKWLKIKGSELIKGDARSITIAAASILAKTFRDQLMIEYSSKYPEYGFEQHKGYGTKKHIAALQEYGPSPIHRQTFITHLLNKIYMSYYDKIMKTESIELLKKLGLEIKNIPSDQLSSKEIAKLRDAFANKLAKLKNA